MYLWCHTVWKQSRAVSDVVYPPMEKRLFCITRFSPLFMLEEEKHPALVASRRGSPAGGSAGISATG